jgi:hypothetical protein
VRYLKEFRAVTRALNARFEGKELVESDKPAPRARCAERVKRGASMVRGLQRYGPCEKEAVFVAPDGKAYCGTHGVAHGYTPPAKPEKKSWLVFYTRPDGKKSFRYSYDKVNEKGVRMAWKRQNPDDKIDGIIPYDGDAAFLKSAEYPKWKEWWEAWNK